MARSSLALVKPALRRAARSEPLLGTLAFEFDAARLLPIDNVERAQWIEAHGPVSAAPVTVHARGDLPALAALGVAVGVDGALELDSRSELAHRLRAAATREFLTTGTVPVQLSLSATRRACGEAEAILEWAADRPAPVEAPVEAPPKLVESLSFRALHPDNTGMLLRAAAAFDSLNNEPRDVVSVLRSTANSFSCPCCHCRTCTVEGDDHVRLRADMAFALERLTEWGLLKRTAVRVAAGYEVPFWGLAVCRSEFRRRIDEKNIY